MADAINVRISGRLLEFINDQTGPDGLYESVSEYVRTLIRRDYIRCEEEKWQKLYEELEPGMKADESEFVAFDPEEIIRAAKKEKVENGS